MLQAVLYLPIKKQTAKQTETSQNNMWQPFLI